MPEAGVPDDPGPAALYGEAGLGLPPALAASLRHAASQGGLEDILSGGRGGDSVILCF